MFSNSIDILFGSLSISYNLCLRLWTCGVTPTQPKRGQDLGELDSGSYLTLLNLTLPHRQTRREELNLP